MGGGRLQGADKCACVFQSGSSQCVYHLKVRISQQEENVSSLAGAETLTVTKHQVAQPLTSTVSSCTGPPVLYHKVHYQ